MQFKRLRHVSFLLNLQSSRDAREIFPAPVLSDAEIDRVFALRCESDFVV